jgi:hypothetical protein
LAVGWIVPWIVDYFLHLILFVINIRYWSCTMDYSKSLFIPKPMDASVSSVGGSYVYEIDIELRVSKCLQQQTNSWLTNPVLTKPYITIRMHVFINYVFYCVSRLGNKFMLEPGLSGP